jgi:cytochrome c biogenesis protein CcdA
MFAANLVYRFNPCFLLYIYLTVSLVLSLAPSRQDMKNAAVGILIIFAAGIFIIWSNFSPAISLLDTVTNVVGLSFGIALGFGLIALVLSLPLLVIGAWRH